MAVGEKTNILDSLNIKEALKLAKRKAKEGQFTESINICNNILERYPLNKDCRVFIKTLPSQEKPQLTGRQDPSSSELSSLIGFYKEGKFQSALEVVQRLQKVYTCSVVLNDLGGEFASELGFLDTAIEYFSKSLEINPSAGMTFYSLANALKRKGNYRSAISNFQQSIEIQPGHVESHFNLANTFKELGDLESAIKHYQRAMEINPSFAGISNNMGSVYARMGQIDLAIDTY
jgi:tetratricopeptide (TPR) repeat protein